LPPSDRLADQERRAPHHRFLFTHRSVGRGRGQDRRTLAGRNRAHQVHFVSTTDRGATGIQIVAKSGEGAAITYSSPQPASADNHFVWILRIKNEWGVERSRISIQRRGGNYWTGFEILRMTLNTERASLNVYSRI
jgi:hypothetical protein